MLEHLNQTVSFIKSRTEINPVAGIVLGTGLGGLIKEIDIVDVIPYSEIPHFPLSTVESHSGNLIFGYLSKKPVIVMQGRFHYYEGYTMQQVIYPIRTMHLLGIQHLFLSNAAGGLNPEMKVSDIMIINDHINLLPESPFRGKHEPEFGPRFPEFSRTYDANLIEKAKEIASNHNIKIFEGVYIAVSGPSLETPAEYKYMRIIGGDAVGMSTVPEVSAAKQMGIPTFAMSVITDEAFPVTHVEVTVEYVIAAAMKGEPKMTTIFKELLAEI